MVYDWRMKLYWRLPVPVQEAILGLYARHLENIYYCKGYKEWKEWLKEWRGWPRSAMTEWQNQQLEHVIATAATQVPFYREMWRGLDWRSIHSDTDLQLLPLLEKQSIRQNERAFIVEGVDSKSLWMEKTSGSTGTALRIYWPMSMVPKWWAITEVMIRNVAGVAQEMPRAMMGGRPVIPGGTQHPPYWRFNRHWNQLYLSSYHVSVKTATDYVFALKKYKPVWMTGYGSTIAALTENALSMNLDPYPLRTVIVSGDTLLPGMRKSIEAFFGCKCYDSYGQCEGVSMAMECEYGRMHVIPPVGIVEILRKDGSLCEPGEVGEMVATTLLNDAMPLVRYRTGDYAAWAQEQICPCDNQSPIITNLEGRVDDYLITADGRRIGRLAAFKRSPAIHSAQIVQDRPGHAYFLVRPGNGYKAADAAAISHDIMEKIGQFDLEMVEVSEIPKTPTGKTVLVVHLDRHPEMKIVYNQLLGI